LPLPEPLQGGLPGNHRVYMVGGAVRDYLLERHPTDIDITVDGDADTFAHAVAERLGARVVPIGKPGQVNYRITSQGILIDITALTGGSLESDLRRRDFTVNALAYDLREQRLVDLLGSRKDIATRRIRMVAEQAFVEDPLRLLRAFRTAALLDFAIEPETLRAIERHSHRINQPAGERLRAELIQLMACPTSTRQIRLMSASGLLTSLIPEMAPMRHCRQNIHHDYDVYDHTLKAYAATEHLLETAGRLADVFKKRYSRPPFRKTTAAILKYAVLLHDIGKPRTRRVGADGSIHFHGHARCSTEMAAAVHTRLRLSKAEQDQAQVIIANHGRPLSLLSAHRSASLRRKGINRLFRECDPWTPEVLLHALGDALGKKETPDAAIATTMDFIRDLIGDYFDRFRPLADQQPLIGGRDLMDRFGLKPSGLLGDILVDVEEARLAGQITTREQALDHAARFLKLKDASETGR
jgi:tRNA nucleotidyltransferase/poly(A) polymerase